MTVAGGSGAPKATSRGGQPRYRRIAALSGSVVVTAVAVLGGLGVLPSGGSPSYAAAQLASQPSSEASTAADVARLEEASGESRTEAPGEAALHDLVQERRRQLAESPGAESGTVDPSADALPTADGLPPPPEGSGAGRRVVFDISEQRVWLIESDESVARTYLASGSLYDNLKPGTYDVQSRSATATGIDDSGTMRYMVRFTHGKNAPIGFHDIPVKDGAKVQSRAELGTPQSHGCIRQWPDDAKALWRFAPIGTTVVVTA